MMNKLKLKVPDIVCGGCAASIKNALGKIEGVGQIAVDVENKIVAVEHDEQKISRDKIAEKLDDIGFSIE